MIIEERFTWSGRGNGAGVGVYIRPPRTRLHETGLLRANATEATQRTGKFPDGVCPCSREPQNAVGPPPGGGGGGGGGEYPSTTGGRGVLNKSYRAASLIAPGGGRATRCVGRPVRMR